MKRWLSRMFRIVLLLLLAAALGLGGYTAWHFQRGGTGEELAKDLDELRVWMLDEEGGVTNFVRRALVPVAQPNRAFEYARTAASSGGARSVDWLKGAQRWLTDGSARMRGIAERDAERGASYTEMLEVGGALLDTATGGRSGMEGVELYFGPDEPGRDDGLSGALLDFVNDAQVAVECACDRIAWNPLAAALVAAQQRGLEVGVVTTAASEDHSALRLLQESGVPVEIDPRTGRMQHRFCVADGNRVWVGGAVFAQAGLFQDYTNALVLESPEIAANYAGEFEEMFVSSAFGRQTPVDTAYPRLELSGTRVENYFAPEDRVENQIIAEIAEAEERIDFMIHTLASRKLADAILSRMVYGLEVRGIHDAGASDEGDEYAQLLSERGARMYVEESPALIEQGVMILDFETVITGSYGYTSEANARNDSSILILESGPLAVRYLRVMDEMAKP